MKLFAMVVASGAALAIGAAYAQDMNHMDMQHQPVHPVIHHPVHHRVAYRRTYKTDQEEHQQTEDLNRQYRGVPSSEIH